MADAPPTTPHPLEQLVAYLDGELDGEQSAAMETRLRNDPKLRRMAEELDRTWGMLDALEPVAADEEFSQQTVQTVISTDSPALERRPRSVAGFLSAAVRSQALMWFGIGVIGTACGLSIAVFRGPSEESVRASRLLRQLDMLQRYPQYSIIPDVESLRQLQLPNDVPPPTSGEEP